MQLRAKGLGGLGVDGERLVKQQRVENLSYKKRAGTEKLPGKDQLSLIAGPHFQVELYPMRQPSNLCEVKIKHLHKTTRSMQMPVAA